MLQSFCIGHIAPFFKPSALFRVVCPRSLGIPNEIVISDERFGSKADGAALSEYSQLFGLSELLKAGDLLADTLHFFQYRKFISPWCAAQNGATQWVNYLAPSDVTSLFPTPDQLECQQSSIVIGKPFQLGVSVAENYSRAHVAEDFAMFCAACITSRELLPGDIKIMSSTTEIIFSPTLCVISTAAFVCLMDTMRVVWDEFRRNYETPREGYQRRSSGYLLERLHSYLLYRMLSRDQTRIIAWNRYIVRESGVILV
jgi:hypothetical protein